MNKWWWALSMSEWPYFIHSSHESIVDSIQVNKVFPKVHRYILLSEFFFFLNFLIEKGLIKNKNKTGKYMKT